MNYIKEKKAFTLLELMIVMMIMVGLMLMAYSPYNYFSNKSKIKVTSKEISQILYESRNLSIHGLDLWSWNLSVWVYFDSSTTNNNSIKIFTFPFSYTLAQIKPDLSDPNILIYKEYKLLPWIQIDNIEGNDNGLFFFKAITWDWDYFYYMPSQNIFSSDELDIKFSYKGSTALESEIKYITRTNISDY